jgi:hypothetical protein
MSNLPTMNFEKMEINNTAIGNIKRLKFFIVTWLFVEFVSNLKETGYK